MPAVRVEMLPTTGVWTDITDRLRTGSPVTIRRGRADRSAQADPGQCTLTLNNKDGWATPGNPLSPWYQQIGRNTPIRVWVQGSTPYLMLPNAAGAQATVASTSAMDVTGDLDVRVDVALDALPGQADDDTVDAEPFETVETNLIARYDRATNQRSWRLILAPNGALALAWSTNGTTAIQALSTEAVPYLAGQRVALRATLDVNNGSAGHTVAFYTADTIAGPWVPLGQPVVTAGTTSIHAPVNVPLNVGAMQSELARGAGRWYGAEVRSGIGGTLVAAPDFTSQPVGTTGFTDSAGRMWLIEGDAEVTDFYQRFYGYAESWPSEWGVGGHDVFVSLRAWGPLKPLRGTKPLQSTLRRRVPSYSPLAYWPMEEPAGTRRIRRAYSPIDDVPFMRTTGLDWGADGSLPGSSPLPKITTGSSFEATVPRPSGTLPSSWDVEFVYYMPSFPPTSTYRSLVWIYATGTVRLWKIMYRDTGARLLGEDASGTAVVDSAIGLGTDVINTWTRQQLRITQTGGDVEWRIAWVKIGSTAGQVISTFTGNAGRVTGVSSPNEYHSDLSGVSIGHIGAFSPADLTPYNFADHGYDGESCADRMRRLAEEEQLPISVLGDEAETAALGPQPIASKLEVVEDAADADGGVVVELRATRGLHYLPRYLRLNRPIALTIPYGRLRELRPTIDDQGVTNDVTVSKPGGTSARAVLRTGRLSVLEPPNGIGPNYDTAVDVNVAEDEQLEPVAYWELYQGTWTGQRYPTVQMLLHRLATDQVQTILDRIDLQARVQIPGTPANRSPGPADGIIEGYEEVIRPHAWELTANATPADPWTVGEVVRATPAAGDPPHKVDSDSSELYAAAGAADTQLFVTTGDELPWVTSTGPAPTAGPTDLPVAITVGGEEMSLTAVQPLAWDQFTRSIASTWGTSTSGQAWTEVGGSASDRSVNGTQGVITLASAPDTTRFQYIDAVLDDGEVLVSITPSQLATGNSFIPAVLLRYVDASNFYRCRAVLTTSGAVQLQVTRTTTVIGSTGNLATYGAGTRLWLRARVDGDRVRGRVWRDGTAEPGGWQIDQTIAASTIATGRAGVTASAFAGNTNVSPSFSYDDFRIVSPQAFTVTRSVNGITKSHDAGSAVTLTSPAIVAL